MVKVAVTDILLTVCESEILSRIGLEDKNRYFRLLYSDSIPLGDVIGHVSI